MKENFRDKRSTGCRATVYEEERDNGFINACK